MTNPRSGAHPGHPGAGPHGPPMQGLDGRGGLWQVDASTRFRLPGAALALGTWFGSAFGALIASAAVVIWTTRPGWAIAVFLTPIVLAMPLMLRMIMAGTVLNPEGLKVRLPWSTRTLAWQDVQQVVGGDTFTGVVGRDGTWVILHGVPVAQWQVVENIRAAAVQRRTGR